MVWSKVNIASMHALGGLITFKQNGLQSGSFDSGIQCSSRNKEVSSKQASNGQVTQRDNLKELNTKFDASHGEKCSIPNGQVWMKLPMKSRFLLLLNMKQVH
jgi:hypothetical protein